MVDVDVVVELEVEGMRVGAIPVDVLDEMLVVLVPGRRVWGCCSDTAEGVEVFCGKTVVVGAKDHPLTQDFRSPVCGMY